MIQFAAALKWNAASLDTVFDTAKNDADQWMQQNRKHQYPTWKTTIDQDILEKKTDIIDTVFPLLERKLAPIGNNSDTVEISFDYKKKERTNYLTPVFMDVDFKRNGKSLYTDRHQLYSTSNALTPNRIGFVAVTSGIQNGGGLAHGKKTVLQLASELFASKA